MKQSAVSRLHAKVGPARDAVERSILGCMLLDFSTCLRWSRVLTTDHFVDGRHKSILAAMKSVTDRGDPPDIVMIGSELQASGCLESIGGNLYLSDLMQQTGSAGNIESYVNQLAEYQASYALIDALYATANSVLAGVPSGECVVDISNRLRNLSVFRSATSTSAYATMSRTIESIEERHRSGQELDGLATGFTDIDRLLLGIRPGNLVVIAARKSVGKTALAMAIAQNIAESGVPVGVISMEMETPDLNLRLLSRKTRIGLKMLRSPRYLVAADFIRMNRAVDSLARTPIFYDDRSRELGQIVESAFKMHSTFNIGALFVDYLQLVHQPRSSENRATWIQEVSGTLKAMAKDLGIPIFALAQLNRDTERRGGDFRPMDSDLRDSGAIEQDADSIILLHRPEIYWSRMAKRYRDTYKIAGRCITNPEGMAEVIVSKNRQGETGDCLLSFVGKYVSFENFQFDEALFSPPPNRYESVVEVVEEEVGDGAGF